MRTSDSVGGPTPHHPRSDAAYHSRHMIGHSEHVDDFGRHALSKGPLNDARYLKAMARHEQASLALGRYRFQKGREDRTSRFAAGRLSQMGKHAVRGMHRPASHSKK